MKSFLKTVRRRVSWIITFARQEKKAPHVFFDLSILVQEYVEEFACKESTYPFDIDLTFVLFLFKVKAGSKRCATAATAPINTLLVFALHHGLNQSISVDSDKNSSAECSTIFYHI